MSGSGKSWSPEEERKLQFEWGVFHLHTLAKRFGRTPVAVKMRARKLGLGAPSRGTETVHQIVQRSGYSKPQIWNAAKALGIPIHRRTSAQVKVGKYRFTSIDSDDAERIIDFLKSRPDGARIRHERAGEWGCRGRGGHMKPEKCVGCQTADRPHYAKDRCHPCYERWRNEIRKENRRSAGPGC